MLIKTVDINEVQWTNLLSLVKTGTEIILMVRNTVIARLVSVLPLSSLLLPDLYTGDIRTSDDFDSHYQMNSGWLKYEAYI